MSVVEKISNAPNETFAQLVKIGIARGTEEEQTE